MTEAEVQADHDIQRLRELINGFQTSQAIYVAVTLGVPDLLRNRALACDELASVTGSYPGALYRLLRALAAIGVLSESEDRRFALAPLGSGLASDAECSRNAWAKFVSGPPLWAAWGQLLHSVRTGEMGFRRAHGQDVWSFRADNPEESALFDLAMRENSRDIARAMLSAYDFTQFGHFVDVGGGNGTLIADLLAACGQATGTFLDLAHVVAGAGGILEQAGVSQRCKVLAGSFFDSVPAGGDVYVMKSILHDWDDREAHTILRNCQEAMHPGARLLIVERILAPPNQGAEGKLSDLNMLVNAGGRERTCEEFTALLAGADFEVRATTRLRVSASSLRRSLVRASEGRLSKAKRVCGRLTPPLPWGNGAMAERQSTDFAGRIQICLPRRAGRFPVAWQGQRRLQAPALPHSTRFVSVHGHSVSGRNDAPSRRIIALTCQRRER